MANTLNMMDATVAHLQARLPSLVVEYFPDKPANYHPSHPQGALLVAYAGSDFGQSTGIGYVVQSRLVKLTVTAVLPELNGKGGAIDVLDMVRRALVGFCPPDCRKARAMGEHFLGEMAGMWHYAIDFAAETTQVEEVEADAGPLLTRTTYEERT